MNMIHVEYHDKVAVVKLSHGVISANEKFFYANTLPRPGSV